MRNFKEDFIKYLTNFGGVDKGFKSDFNAYTNEHRYTQSFSMAVEMLIISAIAMVAVYVKDGFIVKDNILMLRYATLAVFMLLALLRFIVGSILDRDKAFTIRAKMHLTNFTWATNIVVSLISCYLVARSGFERNLLGFVICVALYTMTISYYSFSNATTITVLLVVYNALLMFFTVYFRGPVELIFYIVVMLVICLVSAADRYILLQSQFEEQKWVERSNDRLQELAQEAVKKANEADSARGDFLARISHDMRTPMNGILGMIHLTKQEEISQIVHDNLQKMEITGLYLLGLINDLLDYRKLEDGSVLLKKEPTETSDFIAELCKEFEAETGSRNLELTINNSATNCCLNMDRDRVHQLIMNIFSNAVNFTKPGGSVSFDISQNILSDSKAETVFSVTDTGIGMSEDFLKHIFEPFSQEATDAAKTDGVGLGMAIVKLIVEALEGSINIESEKGKGTKVTVSFVSDLLHDSVVSPVTTASASADLKDKRILICEDNPLNREIAVKLLENRGAIVDCADNGKIGVDMFTGSQPGYYSLILMDIRMPVMNGYDATRCIRALRRTDAAGVPIIAMSANAFREDIQESLKSGMNAHLVKPIVIKEFYSTIENSVAQYEKTMSNA